MSETNGHDANAEGMSRILSIADAKRPQSKSSLTQRQRDEINAAIHNAIMQECAKVHEHYLTQIPHFVARMIQDALLSYGLIVAPPSDIAPAIDPEKLSVGETTTLVEATEPPVVATVTEVGDGEMTVSVPPVDPAA